jgi:hypothetical protein
LRQDRVGGGLEAPRGAGLVVLQIEIRQPIREYQGIGSGEGDDAAGRSRGDKALRVGDCR